jgi:hypothetical protein
MVKIRPRKGGKLKRSVSRWPGVKGELTHFSHLDEVSGLQNITTLTSDFSAHQEPKKASEPAGFNIDGQKMDPDSIYSYDLYDTFDIEFENSPSKSILPKPWGHPTNSALHRSGQLCPQMGRGHQRETAAEDKPRED